MYKENRSDIIRDGVLNRYAATVHIHGESQKNLRFPSRATPLNLNSTICQDIESSRSYVDELYASDTERCKAALLSLKNAVIGSNRQKGIVIQQGVVPRLVHLASDLDLSTDLRLQATIILGKQCLFSYT